MELMRSDDSPYLQALEFEAARNLEPSFLRASRTAFQAESNLMPMQVLEDAEALGAIRNPDAAALFEDSTLGLDKISRIISGLTDPDPDIIPTGTVLSPEEANEKYGIDDKGQKILNYNPTNSIAKTLRKPKEQLKNVLISRAKALKFFENEVKTTAIKLNGAMNQHWIIVKTYK